MRLRTRYIFQTTSSWLSCLNASVRWWNPICTHTRQMHSAVVCILCQKGGWDRAGEGREARVAP